MSLPPSDFAEAFRAHSIPKIRDVIEVRALFVGKGLYSFAEACSDVMSYACRLGASFLPEEHFDAFIDWALAELADASAEVEACGGG